jgi:hypothetical protein
MNVFLLLFQPAQKTRLDFKRIKFSMNIFSPSREILFQFFLQITSDAH